MTPSPVTAPPSLSPRLLLRRVRRLSGSALRWCLPLPLAFASPILVADDAAWQAVARGDAVVVMRHALAPGTGDPADFDVDDCTTQRNLSEAGRAQAETIGAHVAEVLGTREIDVFSSAWCRCLETGRLLGFGEVRTLPPLNSFFRNREAGPGQTEALERWIDERLATADAPPAVLVTHQVNITALTGEFVASGEMFVVDGDEQVLARVRIDAD